jgi:polysaccharide chain length determinant protein (PEP-CTERM system associated)
MSVEFRQRSVGEYLAMARRRKWLILLPALSVFVAVAWVVRGLPNTYVSTTSLTLSPPAISEKVAPSLTDNGLSQRLQAINQAVLSRSSLEPMLEKFDLYPEDRAAGVPIERMVDRLRGNIDVIPEKADNEEVVGFRIRFRNSSPETAQAVTAELARKYVTAQTVESRLSAETTREFINTQLSQAKNNMDALEREKLDIMMRNVETLPESSQGLIAQLEGLRQREATISKDKETLINEKGRIQESIRAMNSQMRLIENFGETETKQAVEQAARIEDTPAYAQLVQKRAEYSARLENLKKQYREKHPDLVQTQTEIAKINEELDKLARNSETRAKQANQAGQRRSELQKKSLEIDRTRAEGQIAQIDSQLGAKDDDLRQNAAQIASLESRINAIPNVKVQLEGVNNQLDLAKSAYDELVKKFNNAQQQVDREANAQGETIRIVDSANLPQSPENASKRPLVIALGAAAGLALGLFLAALFEFPRLLTVQNVEDAKHYTGLPVLAAVPILFTAAEVEAAVGRRKWILAMGLAVSIIIVPLLVMTLQATRIIERIS